MKASHFKDQIWKTRACCRVRLGQVDYLDSAIGLGWQLEREVGLAPTHGIIEMAKIHGFLV